MSLAFSGRSSASVSATASDTVALMPLAWKYAQPSDARAWLSIASLFSRIASLEFAPDSSDATAANTAIIAVDSDRYRSQLGAACGLAWPPCAWCS